MIVPLKPSAIELGHLEQVLASAGWALIVRKIEALHVRATSDAVKAPTWDETLKARGKMEGLGVALQAPHILKQEIEEQLEREGK